LEVWPIVVDREDTLEMSEARTAPVDTKLLFVEKKMLEMDPLKIVERLLRPVRTEVRLEPVTVENVERPVVREERLEPVMVENVERPVVREERLEPVMVENVERPVVRVERLDPRIVERVERPTWATEATVLIPI
jgi:hypothetical protein